MNHHSAGGGSSNPVAAGPVTKRQKAGAARRASANPRPDVESVLAPLSIEEFRATYWSKRHFVGHLSPEHMAQLRADLHDFEPSVLIDRHTGPLAAWFQRQDDRFQSLKNIGKPEAKGLYGAGMTIFMNNASPAALLVRWRHELARALDHPGNIPAFDVFASPKGSWTRCHLDKLENFTFQLRGRKRWRIAPNRHVANPTHNFMTRGEIPPEFELYAKLPLPEQMPRGAFELVLGPGDLLYLPRGWWHETECLEESVSVFLGFEDAPWARLVTESLHAYLLRSEAWRENFTAHLTGEQTRADARAQLAALLKTLPAALAELTADDLMPAAVRPTLTASSRVRRNPLATLGAPELPSPAAMQVQLIVRHHRGHYSYTRELIVTPRVAAICLRLNQLSGCTSVRELAKRTRGLAVADLAQLLEVLVEVGFLHVEPAGKTA